MWTTRPILYTTVSLGCALSSAAWADEPPTTPVTTAFEAVGRHEQVVRLPTFGRYAFEATSEVGTTLQIVDRMQGPGPLRGRLGEEDGRIDVFLDQGEAKVLLRSPDDGRGQVSLTVDPFEPAEPGVDRQLIRNRPELTELEDLQTRSWWFEAKGEQSFEVAGRYLADVRLWRDGTWLVEDVPQCGIWEAEEGRPLTRCVLNANLEGGTYQLVAYGGPGTAWANDVPDSILNVRWDLPKLPANGQRTGQIGPTGLAFFEVDADADLAHLALPDTAPAEVQMRGYTPRSMFDLPRGTKITDESRTPEATSRQSGGNGSKVIAVRGIPGQRYTLTWFDEKRSHDIRSGKVLVSSLSTARPSDDLVVTGMFWERRSVGGVKRAVANQGAGVRLDAGRKFEQRFNLLGDARLVVEIPERTNVKFAVTEGEAKLRLEPYLTSYPKDYRKPAYQRGEVTREVDAGFYILSITPVEKGIVTLQGYRNNWSDLANAAIADLETMPLRPGVLEQLDVNGVDLYASLEGPPGAQLGFAVHDLPLTGTESVSLPLAPGERVTLPVKTSEPVTLVARTPTGERLTLHGLGNPTTELRMPVASAAIGVENTTDQPVIAVFGPLEKPPEPVSMPDGFRDDLPDYPQIASDSPWFGDLDRNSRKTVQLEVGEDGLYAVESTGLLAMKGTMRSRVALNLGRGINNGDGRNFRVARYLRSGTYQITTETTGRSTGHFGVRLKPSELRDGGLLRDGDVGRATLEPGVGVSYRFEVDERASWAIRSAGQKRTFACRIEDADGWPVVAPDANCDRTLTLDPGTYTVRSLPTWVESRRRTSVRRIRASEQLEGHGPHPLPLGRTVSHVWAEPPGDGERPKDVWTLSLPADLKTSIDLGDEMAGALMRDGEVVGRLSPGKDFSMDLDKGEYTLEVRSASRGTGVPYTVKVSTDALTVGQKRSVYAPATLDLAFGEAGQVTLRSDGNADVRARLLDADGRVLAANDDRPDDWNFRIAHFVQSEARLRLEIEPNGSDRRTTVEVMAPEEKVGESLKVGNRRHTLEVGPETGVYPLELSPTRTELSVVATADQNIGVAVEIQTQNGWQSLGSASGPAPAMLARRTPGLPARLRVWSLDGRRGTAEVTVDADKPRTPNADQLQSGWSIRKDAFVAVRGDRVAPGLYRVRSDRSELSVCPRLGAPCHPAGGVVTMNKASVLFGRRFQLERADLAGEPVPVELDSRPTALETGLKGLVAVELRAASGVALARMENDAATAVSEDGALAIGRGEAAVQGEGVGRVRAVALTWTRTPFDPEAGWSGEVPARSAIELPLGDDSDSSLAVSLERGLVAQVGEHAVWADRDALSATLAASEAGAKGLVLANPTDSPVLARVSLDSSAAAPIVSGQPVEQLAPRAGVLHRRVSGTKGGDGRLRAANASLIYLRDDGELFTADGAAALDGVPLGEGGQVWIRHGTGWFATWSDAGGVGPWPATDAENLAVNAGVTHIEADLPYAALVDVDGQRRVEWRPEGGIVAVLAAEGGRVQVRSLGVDAPRPVVPRVARQDVTEIGEGLGPEVLLDAGGAAWFRFELDQDGPVGIGARAGADRVEATVVSPDGNPVAHGVVRRVELEKGTWYLRLTQPADASPVRVRPALAGLERPDTGPPDSVIQTYVDSKNGGAQ